MSGNSFCHSRKASWGQLLPQAVTSGVSVCWFLSIWKTAALSTWGIPSTELLFRFLGLGQTETSPGGFCEHQTGSGWPLGLVWLWWGVRNIIPPATIWLQEWAFRTSLVVEWLRNHLAMKGTRVGPKARSHMSQSSEAHALQLLKPVVPGACAPQERPPQREARARQQGAAPAWGNWRKLSAATKAQCSQKRNKYLEKEWAFPSQCLFTILCPCLFWFCLRGSPGQMSFSLSFLQNESRNQSKSESCSVVSDSLRPHAL